MQLKKSEVRAKASFDKIQQDNDRKVRVLVML